jgi:iron(III) transport system substrate-binding protein
LFVDFALTDGQRVLEKVKRIPSVPGGWDPIAGLQTVEVPEDELLANPKKWDQEYTEVTQKGTQTN